jgi:Carboxypeptidase regulatory-like domain
MGSLCTLKTSLTAALALVSALLIAVPPARGVTAVVTVENNGGLGIIRGMVRDEGGSPISDATVAIFRLGTSKLLKQVQSASDGSFLAKIVPGTYTVLAVAQGFNPVTLPDVEVNKSADIVYGFRLERAGAGNTLPEKRADRNSSKWHIRAAAAQRSIYQHRNGNAPVDETAEAVVDQANTDPTPLSRRGQSVVETYFADGRRGNYAGINFATAVPVADQTTVVFAGQLGKGRQAPLRLETDLKLKPFNGHQIRLGASFGSSAVRGASSDSALGQFSLQATDEWKFRDGVILVLGLDYSKFTGVGTDSSLTPRLGLQFDVNAKTRVRSAFTSQTDEVSWSQVVDLEDSAVVFREPVAVEDLVAAAGRPRMNRSTRLEFGVERVLDNRSSIELNAFFDATAGRGVGINSFSFDTLSPGGFSDLVADQQGRSQGLRAVYSRRVGGPFTVSAGYSLGTGQKLSDKGISDPGAIFENGFFQSFFSQVAARLNTGTSVKTVFRLSPQATVFAIDPFKGSLSIYDPGLSVLITQSLPSLGLPIHAEVVVDGRNLFDFQTGIRGDDGGLRLSAQSRMLRGGVLVRF